MLVLNSRSSGLSLLNHTEMTGVHRHDSDFIDTSDFKREGSRHGQGRCTPALLLPDLQVRVPVCDRRCSSRLLGCLKGFPHNSHAYCLWGCRLCDCSSTVAGASGTSTSGPLCSGSELRAPLASASVLWLPARSPAFSPDSGPLVKPSPDLGSDDRSASLCDFRKLSFFR